MPLKDGGTLDGRREARAGAVARAGTTRTLHVDSVTYLTCNVVYQEDPSLCAMMKVVTHFYVSTMLQYCNR
jgi:hypothetical protein